MAQIKQNWETFFDPKTTIADKEKYLQNGQALAPLLSGFAADPRVGQVSATVSNVTFTSPTTATVTYALSLQGTVVEPNATGKAVLQDGTWKVADSTLCGLVALTGNTQAAGMQLRHRRLVALLAIAATAAPPAAGPGCRSTAFTSAPRARRRNDADQPATAAPAPTQNPASDTGVTPTHIPSASSPP